MRSKGITYDTGTFPAGRSSRPDFDPEQVRREMDAIAGELRCDAVRITGGDLKRLSIAGRHAVDAGLEVWLSLGAAAARARESFSGPITYAAGPWEDVNWEPFDFVAVDAYRDASNADGYREQIQALTTHGKPAAVTEFGCCTFRGAADRRAHGWMILTGSGSDRRVGGTYERDEEGQARYLTELVTVFDQEGVDTAFWHTFASYDKPRRDAPEHDLDLASYGVIALLEPGIDERGRSWVSKLSFAALSGYPQASALTS